MQGKQFIFSSVNSTSFSWYEDNHVTEAIDQALAHLGGYQQGAHYLLQGGQTGTFIDAEDQQAYWVAITPALDTIGLSLPLTYFFDKTQQPSSSLATILAYLLPNLAQLSQLSPSLLIARLRDDLQDSTTDDETLACIAQELQTNQFDERLMQARISDLRQQRQQHDVFDEIGSLLASVAQGQVKILFPYNQTQTHWLTGEIKLGKNQDAYTITCYAHDPCGGGTFTKTNAACLQQAIEKRLGEVVPNLQSITFAFRKSPYLTRRQALGDTTSCGVIVAHELIKRLQGQTLDRTSPFTSKELTQLRQIQGSKRKTAADCAKNKPVTTNTSQPAGTSSLPKAELPLPIKEEKDILMVLKTYYQSQATFRQGLSNRQESITQSFINLSIIPHNLQQQKEQALAEDEDQQAANTDEERNSNDNTKEAFARDERLASYEALRTNPEPIALEDLFKQAGSASPGNQRVLVLGRAGIGKTTLSQHIAYRWAVNDLWPKFTYVFWLPLRNLNQPHDQTGHDVSLALLIAQECFKNAPADTISADAIHTILTTASSKTLLILDGYDEVAHLANSSNALGQVLRQALAFPNVLATSRPYAAPDKTWFDCCLCLEVMGFTNDNILAYVNNYFNHDEVNQPQEVEPLQQFLKNNPNIWGTAHVPINLALICNAWEQAVAEGKTLNVRLSMTGLYLNLVQDLLKRFVERKGKLIYEAQPQWLEKHSKSATKTLEALAAKGLANQQLILTQSVQQDVLSSLNETKAEEALNEAVSLGLLQPIGAQQAQALATSHYFIHLTFQEFFAARYYVHGLQQASDTEAHQQALTFIREQKYNPFYQLVFWFMAGLLSASEKERPLILFWQALLAKPHDLISLAHLRLIIHCLDEAQIDKRIPQRDNLLCYCEQALETVILGRKVGFFEQFTENWRYESAAYALEKSFSQFLLTELSHTSYLNQDPLFFNQLTRFAKKGYTSAISVLARLNLAAKAINLLCELAAHNNDYAVKSAAIYTLGNFKESSSAVIDLFCKQAVNNESEWVRETALEALSKLKDPSPDIIDLLCKRAVQDEDNDIRKTAITALSKLTTPTPYVIGLLCERAVQDRSEKVRKTAIVVLGKLKNLSSIVIDFLYKQALQNESDKLRQAAINALGNLKDPSLAIIDLIYKQAVQDKRKRRVRQAALATLSNLKDPSSAVIALLCKQALDSNIAVRRNAIYSLVKLKDASSAVIALLCEQALNKDIAVRRNAIYSLAKLEDSSSAMITLLCEQVLDKDIAVRRNAIYALSELKNSSSAVIALLCEQALDKNIAVRRSAIFALSRLKDPSSAVIALLCEQVLDKDIALRRHVIYALSKLKDPSSAVIALLCEHVLDKDIVIRRNVIYALSRLIHPSSAVIHILCERAVKEKHEFVKSTIVKTLFSLHPKLLFDAYLDCINQAYSSVLALCITKSVLHHQAGLIVTENNIVLSAHRPFVFKFLPLHKSRIVKKLLNACQTLRETYRLPQVASLNQFALSVLEEGLLYAKEEKPTSLALIKCGLDDQQVLRLVELMKIIPPLRFLDLSYNAITDQGAFYLAKSLVDNHYLTRLNLAYNQLTNTGAQALLHVLTGNPFSTRFIFFTNAAIKPNRVLCHLDLIGNEKINQLTLGEINKQTRINQKLQQISQRLLESIKRSELAGIEQAFNAGALLTATTPKGDGPLHVAACYGQQEAVQYLLAHYPACLNSLNCNGMTAFYLACVKGQWDIAEYLLTQGADIHAVDYQGRSALHLAALHYEFVVLKYLLTKMVKDLNKINLADKDGQTPLHYAILAQNEHNVRLLIKAGANPMLSNKQGKTPLIMASELCNPALIGCLENALQNQSAAALPIVQADNWVKIYLWPSQLKQRSLGHIALETPYFYVSFWPQNYRLQDGLSPVDSAFASSLEEDIQAEHFRKPQVYCLYSLDVNEINAEFGHFCQKPRQWALKGRKQSSEAQNCSGLVYELLVAGGIEQLATINWSTKVLPTPNAIGQIAQLAQQAEQQRYPVVTTYTPTPSLHAQQQYSVQPQEKEGYLVATLVTKLEQKLDEQTKLMQEHWKNDNLARQVQTLSLERRFLRLEQRLYAGFFSSPPKFAQATTTSEAELESTATASAEEVISTESP